MEMEQNSRNFHALCKRPSSGSDCYSISTLRKIYCNITGSMQCMAWLIVLSLCYNNAFASEASEPRIEGGSPSNLVLKVNAVQSDISRLIEAFNNKNASSPPSNSLAPGSESATGGFTRPTPSDKLNKLENEMKKMKGDIEQLMQSANITAEDKERLSGLEDSVKNLQKLLDDQRYEFEQKIEKLGSLVETLIATINVLRIELDNLTQKALLEEEDRKLRRLPSECIDAIRSHDFATAESKLREIKNDSTIYLIVNSVYDHHVSNFDLLLRFAECVGEKQRSFLIYKALGYEMEINEHRDPLKMIRLIESLRIVVINNQGTSSQTKRDAQSFEDNLKNSIKMVSKEKLKHAMLNNVYTSEDIKTLSNSIYRTSDKLFRSLITEVVNEVYGRMDTKKLLKDVNSHTFLQQSIPGYSAVFNKIKRTSNSALFNIAYYIKDAMAASTYASLDSNNKAILNDMKNSLPRSVRNAAFASKVCIGNTKYPKYLFASGKYLHDKPRRSVFTWMPNNNREDRPREDQWQIIRTGESFYFFNVAHREYMYSPSEYKDFKEGNDRRKVFTWTEGNSFESCKWNMEIIGDNVYIKSVVRSEYLYTSNRYKHKRVNQKIFTWIPGGPVGNGLWTIDDCSRF